MRILCWNLKRPDGRRLRGIAERLRDLGVELLMAQETRPADGPALGRLLGGASAFTAAFPLRQSAEGHLLWRRHGPVGPVQPLSFGGWPWPRVAQLFRLVPDGPVAANLQLSHGPLARRRELGVVAGHRPALIAGDLNWPEALHLPGWHDATPIDGSFRLGPLRLRLDRVLVADTLPQPSVRILPHGGLSDHDALLIDLPL